MKVLKWFGNSSFIFFLLIQSQDGVAVLTVFDFTVQGFFMFKMDVIYIVPLSLGIMFIVDIYFFYRMGK